VAILRAIIGYFRLSASRCARYRFAGFGAGPESGSSQIFAMSQLTANATTQPKITSLTRRRPVSAPTIFECVDRQPAMTTAQPTSVLIRRLRNILRPCFTTGSLEAIAQIGLACAKNRSVIQTIIEAMKTFTANRKPRKLSSRSGPDTITWQSKDRTLDGKALPDTVEIKMKRGPSNNL
jgi:hypothetical protein